jgi:acylphosphatase
MMPLRKTVRLRISGEVQGVGYRIWATRTAAGLGLRGWVRNRFDGSVEVLATGAADAVAAMVEACRHGPRAARVAAVTVSDAQDDGSRGFGALPTE